MATQNVKNLSCKFNTTADAPKRELFDVCVGIASGKKAAAQKQKAPSLSWDGLLKGYEPKDRSLIQKLLDRKDIKAKASAMFSCDLAPGQTQVHIFTPSSSKTFGWLSWSRKLIAKIREDKHQDILFDLRLWQVKEKDLVLKLIDVILTAYSLALHEGPKYETKSASKTKKKKDDDSQKKDPSLTFYLPQFKALEKELEAQARHSLAEADATNLVRFLSVQAGNDLNPKSYVSFCEDLAKKEKLSFKHHTIKDLKSWGAGAFLAVAQGSDHTDGGIVEISYEPKAAKRKIALVGKGITFDTGGVNVKTGSYMFGMNGDMAGSALALSLVRLASRLKWDFEVRAYLAITDNAIGSRAFRPNDVVTTLSGKTIEVVHTDAEGRMILSDTLTYASRKKPDLVMDFATLTGSCVRAIGTNYSGVFTNRRKLNSTLIKAGEKSGERCWPFPIDKDYGDCLKSDIADTKQCRLTGGPDHIEAAVFLQKFLEKKVAWVHVDLSAIEHEGGLGAAPTTQTGFGVRFTSRFLRDYLK